MSTSITIYTRNILETSTAVTVTGTPDSGYPEARLHDRHISLYWKDTASTDYVVVARQSTASWKKVDFLAVEKHNFNGKAMRLGWSTGGVSYSTAAKWTQSGTSQIIKTLSSALTKRYWRVTVAGASNPQASEVYLSQGFSWNVLATPDPVVGDYDNVQWNRTVGGVERATKFGEKRRRRQYTLLLSSTQITDFRASMADLDGYSKPFYLKDHDGKYYMVRLEEMPDESYPPFGSNIHAYVTLKVVEQL